MIIEEKKIWYSPNINSIQQGANEQLDMSYKSFQAHAITIRDELKKILNSSDNEKTKTKKCIFYIKTKLKSIFGEIFNHKYFIHSTIQFFQKFDADKIFRFLIDNLRVYQRKQNCQLHQALEETQEMSPTQKAYQQALEQSFTDSCKRIVIINKRKINISPRQAKSILYKLDKWIEDHQGFIGYQKAGQELELNPQHTYQTISAMMKAVGQNKGLEKILKWNQIQSSDWVKINNLFEILNDETSRGQWIQEHQGFQGYQKAGQELGLGPQDTYKTISAMMKAVGEDKRLEAILDWNQISSSDWEKINNLFKTLNNQKSREKWIQEHQGFQGYQKAGQELGLGPQDTYQTISAIMKAIVKDKRLEEILGWNQFQSSDWTKINNLFKTLNNQKSRNKWIQDHQGFKGYQKAAKELGLSPSDTYQTISAMMKAVGQKRGLEKLLKWNQIKSSSWEEIISIHRSLGETQLDDELKQSLLLLFSRSKDQHYDIINFIDNYNQKLEELRAIIQAQASTPDFNSVLQQLNISSDMLRALFLSYNSYKLKTFANKVLGAVYHVLPTQNSDQEFGLSSRLESRTDSPSLQRASELLLFLLNHKNLEESIKILINQFLLEQDEKLMARIATQIPQEIIKEFSEMNMGI